MGAEFMEDLSEQANKCVESVTSCNIQECEITQETFYKMIPCKIEATCTASDWWKFWTYSCEIDGECKRPSFRDIEKCTQVLTTCIGECVSIHPNITLRHIIIEDTISWEAPSSPRGW